MRDIPILVEFYIVTPHGEPVRSAKVSVVGAMETRIAVEDPLGAYRVKLPAIDDYLLTVEKFGDPDGYDHRTYRTTLFYVNDGEPHLFHLAEPDGQRSRIESVDGDDHTFRVRLTLDYLWFTHIGYEPTRNNRVDVFADGASGWATVAKDVEAATESVHLTTWIYQPTTELLRPSPLAEPAARRANTVGEMLARTAESGVTVRLLVWDAPVIDIPAEAREIARRPDDNFEIMEQANPTEVDILPESFGFIRSLFGGFEIGSYHQKSVIVDGRVGFCAGMNLKENDWDTCDHELFDPRRCKFSRDHDFRKRVADRKQNSDHRPRHDFIARVEGPAVEHLGENFRQRWNHLIDEGATYSEAASPVPAQPRVPPAGRSQVQVVRTMPKPFEERGILNTYLRAIESARKLIYVEDQYFRSTHISDAIADAVRKWPDIRVVVVTLQSQADDFFAGGWSREAFDRIARRCDSFYLFSLKIAGTDAAGKRHLEEVDNHAKLMIVDDLYLTVGSCNINDRGFEYEGELNIAVVDADLVKKARMDIWREHLNDDPRLTGEVISDCRVWMEHARHNARFAAGDEAVPRSHIYPFQPRSDRLILTGPDVL